MMDRGFRTREQVRAAIDADCLALVPQFESLNGLARGDRPIAAAEMARGRRPRMIQSTHPMLRIAADFPASPYAEAIRAIKLDLDRKGSYKAGSDDART